MADNQNDQLKTPAEEDDDLSKATDKPSAPAESGSDRDGGSDSEQLRETRPTKTADVRGR